MTTRLLLFFSLCMLPEPGLTESVEIIEDGDVIASDVIDLMTPHQRRLFDTIAEWASVGSPIPTVCWTEGTDSRIVDAFHSIGAHGATGRYQLANRWTVTATDGGGLVQGHPTNVTWSVVPDGTTTPAGPSDLIAVFDAHIPGWLSLFQDAFDGWGELSGINYIYEPNDDGAPHWVTSGLVGVRGDVRIGGTFIDGPSGTLAFNDFPNNGDMVIDTSDRGFFDGSADEYRALRNTVMHEAGHGLGLFHVESSTDDFLMEPFINLSFDGPQLDDIRGAHRHYGDREEFPVENDEPLTATHLGTPDADGTLIRIDQSVDDNSDVDVHSFDVTLDAASVTSITVVPTGRIYNQGPQGSGGGAPLDSRAVTDLQFQLLGTNGTDVLGSASATGLGEAEVLNPGALPEVPGTYFVRTFNSGENAIQIYDLEVVLGPGIVAAENPAPAYAPLFLGDAKPNPFNPTAAIAYEIGTFGEAELTIHDVAGRLVRTLAHGDRPAGRYQVVWSGTDDAGRAVASGVYLYTLQTTAGTITKRMVMAK